MRALIVNEEPRLRRILSKAARRTGYSCPVAATGVDGVRAIAQGGFDGLGICLEALKRGADVYVVKPFGIEQIDHAIERAEERHSLLAAEAGRR